MKHFFSLSQVGTFLLRKSCSPSKFSNCFQAFNFFIEGLLKEILRELPYPLFNDQRLYLKLIALWKEYKYSKNIHSNESLIIETVHDLPTANKVCKNL